MKSSSLPLRYVGMVFVLIVGLSALYAQDSIVLTNGQRQEGKILGITNNAIRIQRGPTQTALSLSQIKKVEMSPPAELAASQEALAAGNASKALQILQPIAENFRGLPIAWAEQAAATLGDLYLQTNQLPKAEAAFAAFEKAYPDAKNMASLGLAQLAVAKKEYAKAKPLLTPIVNEALGKAYADSTEGITYGRALLLMGEIQEAEGDFPAALSSYLTTVTIYYQDPHTAAQAQSKADILKKDKKITVP